MKMTILKHMSVANNVFRSQSMSVIANFLPGRVSSECAFFNSVSPLVQRKSSLLWIRSFSSNQAEDRSPKSSTSEAQAWKERIFEVVNRLFFFSNDTYVCALRYLQRQRDEEFQLSIMEKEKFSYRKRWAMNRLLNKIEDIGRRLIDENVSDKCQVFYLTDPFDKWIIFGEGSEKLETIHYDECWLSVIKSSEKPLAHKLREELNEAGITPENFSQSVSKVYIKLQEDLIFLDFWSIDIVDYGLDDIKKVLDDLSLNDTEYKCIKIIFNLEESEKWQIKDCEKVQHPADC